MARISLKQVVVDFPIVNAAAQSLQLRLYQALGGKLTAHHKIVVVRALDGIDLELKDGDRLGLIGRNGSGKTTLLRVLAGVYPPTGGCASIDGSISSFTDLALGMDPEATGWDNIIFRCVFLGLSFREAKQLAPTIANFSELGEYLDLPARTYSSGMFLRLAFAISTCIEPDILIMDEMITAGDAQFIQKAERRLHEIVGKANILALASHDMTIIENICNKVLWLDHGLVKQFGPPDAILEAYRSLNLQAAEPARTGGTMVGLNEALVDSGEQGSSAALGHDEDVTRVLDYIPGERV
jgi:ABC-type polysaccharide/polyol phosphate transport system ATPase subunit